MQLNERLIIIRRLVMSEEKRVKKVLDKMEREERKVSRMSLDKQREYQQKKDERVLREMDKKKRGLF